MMCFTLYSYIGYYRRTIPPVIFGAIFQHDIKTQLK